MTTMTAPDGDKRKRIMEPSGKLFICCNLALSNCAFVSVHTSFINLYLILFKKSDIDKSTEWSTILACSSLLCFF